MSRLSVAERAELRAAALPQVDEIYFRTGAYAGDRAYEKTADRPWTRADYDWYVNECMGRVRDSRVRRAREARQNAEAKARRGAADRQREIEAWASRWPKAGPVSKPVIEANVLRLIADGQAAEVAAMLRAIADRIDL